MPAPSTSAAYKDCEKVLNQALESEKGLRVDFATLKEARYYRFRLNACRSINRKENRRIYPPDHVMFFKSLWDPFVFKIDEERPAVLIHKEVEMIGTVSVL